MNKIVRIGKTKPEWTQKSMDVFCSIKFKEDNQELSISGVIGPLPDGNAEGGCGQIDMEFEHRNIQDNDKRYDHPIKPEEIQFEPGWNKEKWYDFLDIWNKYHLNSMNAGCEHQRAERWGKKELTLIHYKMISTILSERTSIEKRTQKELVETGYSNMTEEERRIMSLPYEWTLPGENDRPEYGLARAAILEHYQEDKNEKKMDGWVYPKEHPEGKLMKPCSVCGYKYGSAWLKIEVPKEVIEWLETLPETDKQPAWI